jgi:hypothetical protein
VPDNFNFYESIELGDGPKKLDRVISSESAKIIRSWFKPMATPATVIIEFSTRFGVQRHNCGSVQFVGQGREAFWHDQHHRGERRTSPVGSLKYVTAKSNQKEEGLCNISQSRG